MVRQIENLQEAERKYTDDYNALIKKYDEQREVIRKMSDAQRELKHLIDEERQAYNEDRNKYESDLVGLKHAAETKMKIVRAKFTALFDGNKETA